MSLIGLPNANANGDFCPAAVVDSSEPFRIDFDGKWTDTEDILISKESKVNADDDDMGDYASADEGVDLIEGDSEFMDAE